MYNKTGTGVGKGGVGAQAGGRTGTGPRQPWESAAEAAKCLPLQGSLFVGCVREETQAGYKQSNTTGISQSLSPPPCPTPHLRAARRHAVGRAEAHMN